MIGKVLTFFRGLRLANLNRSQKGKNSKKIIIVSIDLQKIKLIAENLWNCNEGCEGINNNPSMGIVPRCLHFENEEIDEEKNGCIIVGLNPGKSSPKERSKIQSQILNNSISNNWTSVPEFPYYRKLRKFAQKCGLGEVIYWTELVKCECYGGQQAQNIPFQTYRNCVKNFLKDEIELIGKEWIIIAVGREAHKGISYMFPDRTVIGIPHPTSSRGNFDKLFLNVNGNKDRLKENVLRDIEFLKSNPGNTKWIIGLDK